MLNKNVQFFFLIFLSIFIIYVDISEPLSETNGRAITKRNGRDNH